MKYVDKKVLLAALRQGAEIHENVAQTTTGLIAEWNLMSASGLHVLIQCVETGMYDVREEQE